MIEVPENLPPEQRQMLDKIKDQTSNLLFFALGRTGICADEFAAATDYFFDAKSSFTADLAVAGLATIITPEKFREGLKLERNELVAQNEKQMNEYLRSLGKGLPGPDRHPWAFPRRKKRNR